MKVLFLGDEMSYEQAVQKFQDLVKYYDALVLIAQRTGGGTGALDRYYAVRDHAKQVLGGSFIGRSHFLHKSDEEIVIEFGERALRIFQF